MKTWVNEEDGRSEVDRRRAEFKQLEAEWKVIFWEEVED